MENRIKELEEKITRMHAERSEDFARRVPVERALLDVAAGKRPLPTTDECHALTIKLGVPDELRSGAVNWKGLAEQYARDLKAANETNAEIRSLLAESKQIIDELLAPSEHYGFRFRFGAREAAEAFVNKL